MVEKSSKSSTSHHIPHVLLVLLTIVVFLALSVAFTSSLWLSYFRSTARVSKTHPSATPVTTGKNVPPNDYEIMNLASRRLDKSVCDRIGDTKYKADCLSRVAQAIFNRDGAKQRQSAVKLLTGNGIEIMDCNGPVDISSTEFQNGNWIISGKSPAAGEPTPVVADSCTLSPDKAWFAREYIHTKFVITDKDNNEWWTIKLTPGQNDLCYLEGWSADGIYLVADCGSGSMRGKVFYNVTAKREQLVIKAAGGAYAWLDADNIVYQQSQPVPTPIPIEGGDGYGIAVVSLKTGQTRIVEQATSTSQYWLNGVVGNDIYFSREDVKSTHDYGTENAMESYWKISYPLLEQSASSKETAESLNAVRYGRGGTVPDFIRNTYPELTIKQPFFFDRSRSHPSYVLFTCEGGNICFADLEHPETKAPLFPGGKYFFVK